MEESRAAPVTNTQNAPYALRVASNLARKKFHKVQEGFRAISWSSPDRAGAEHPFQTFVEAISISAGKLVVYHRR